jgi:predicted lipoprotein with Yx(FWY)xxD motif
MSWTTRAVVAALVIGGSSVATAGIASQAQAQARPAAGTSARVVNAAMRTGFGKILVTVSGGHSLYEHPKGACTGGCLSVWPALLMPAGATVPKGASCLATAKMGANLQVTYHGQKLYTFTGDTGHSVNGNGVAGFVVAKVTKACP